MLSGIEASYLLAILMAIYARAIGTAHSRSAPVLRAVPALREGEIPAQACEGRVTPEQEKQIAEIRERNNHTVLTHDSETQPGDGADAHYDRDTLLDIIDDLRKQLTDAKRLNPDGVYVIFFEDQSVKPEFFGGPGALHGATERHKQLSQNWACHIFSQISNREKATKQYAIEDLRAQYEKSHLGKIVGSFGVWPENGMYKNPMVQSAWAGWKACARFLGVIKAEVA